MTVGVGSESQALSCPLVTASPRAFPGWQRRRLSWDAAANYETRVRDAVHEAGLNGTLILFGRDYNP